MSTFEDTIQQVHDEKSAAAGEAPDTSETPSTETLAVESPSPETQSLVETPTDDGTREEPKKEETQPTTEDETQFNLTGLETPEDLTQRHGEGWMSKTARKHLAVVKEVGGSQNLRLAAQLIRAVQNPETKGREVLNLLPPDRTNAIRDDIIWATLENSPGNQEIVLQGILKSDVTLDFVKQAVANELQYGTNTETPAEGTDDLSDLPPAIKEKLANYDKLMAEVPELRKQITGYGEERKTEAQQKFEEQTTKLGNELYESVFSVVEERKSKLGLEVSPTDTPRVAGIKRAIANHLSSEKVEAAFMGNEINSKLSDLAIAEVKRNARDAAFAYKNDLAVGAEVAFQEMLKSPEVSSLLEALKSEMESQSTPKNPTARDEMVQGTAAGFTATDPFDEGAKLGKRPFDIAVELAGRGAARA